MSHTDKNIIKNLSIDCVVFGFTEGTLKVLLIKRKREPSKGEWALPGGFILNDENLDKAALRILEETSNVKNIYLEQVHTFGQVDRFPLRRVITITYLAIINPDKHSLKPGTDTSDVKWVPIESISNLPFDHSGILTTALEKLRMSLKYKPIGAELLPRKFTLTQLQILYESILGVKLDKRNFRKKMLVANILVQLDEFQKDVAHRAARLFKFDLKNYKKFKETGINF